MNIGQLRELLDSYEDHMEVMILDGFNAGGHPRTLNFGPQLHDVTAEDVENTYDCEHLVGATVIVLGYGCY
jgi:hypothetical protein